MDVGLADRLNKDIDARRLIHVLCDCEIEYYGRSRSEVGCGHRTILIKPDTTLIIHSPAGFKPLNWMSAPTETVAEAEDCLLLHSQKTKKPYEEIKIRIKEVLDYRSYEGVEDNGKISVIHTEKDLQDHLAKNPEMVHPDFRLKATEYSTPLGFFDLYGKIGETYVVVELKAERAGLPAALQIKRYVEWLKENVKDARGILMASGITPNAEKILRKENIEFRKIDIRKLGIKHKKKEKTLEEWL